MPDGFLLKSVVFKLISKEISRAEHEYMNIPPPPPPINALGTALVTTLFIATDDKQLHITALHRGRASSYCMHVFLVRFKTIIST